MVGSPGLAMIPALLAVAILALAVREPAAAASAGSAREPIRRRDLRQLTPAYWLVVAFGSLFTLARFS